MRGYRLKYITRMAAVAVTLSVPLLAGSCSLDTKTAVVDTSGRVELRQASETIRLPTAKIDAAGLAGVADQYRHFGQGPVDLTVTYDPKSKTNTAMKAADSAANISTYLRRKTGAEVKSDIIPVIKSGDVSEVLLTYNSITAQEPDCSTMGGSEGKPTKADDEYKYGCTTETNIARQIARPADLMGRSGLPADGDGRRQANVGEGYRTGKPNPALKGYSISD